MPNAETVCRCGARYRDFRSTDGAGNVLTFADVHAMMRVASDDSSLWIRRSRGAVLRFWSFLKTSQWDAMHGYCEAALEAASVAVDATADELPEWVTDTTVAADAEIVAVASRDEVAEVVAPVTTVAEAATEIVTVSLGCTDSTFVVVSSVDKPERSGYKRIMTNTEAAARAAARGRIARDRNIRDLERAHERAMRAERDAIQVLDATPKSRLAAAQARCWELVAATNRAREALRAAYDAAATEAA